MTATTIDTAGAFKSGLDEKQAYVPATQTCVVGKVCGHYMNIVSALRRSSTCH